MGGGITLDLAEDDLGLTLRHVVEELQLAHPDREIAVSLDLPPALAVDKLRLAQLFSNLVSNAITHGVETEPVRIVAGLNGGVLEVSVANGGQPISEETIARLFQPFRRGDLRPSMQGLGLGLFIASEIATAHGGKIEVNSDEVETRFTFRMPSGPGGPERPQHGTSQIKSVIE
ncbi:histidine kinase/DNA gyrase B/HSP90-like ATPase [Neorhizobium alkalisoli]|uniref:histidine kinase n=2 Tax=Neorhizobium alkalisoli TaxID=528178 RepID=A0A561QBR3_9HYPH|nr:histidine kinase/DNA gyrase B/HSP90-like ATPase [Neorhizobium alkalisoli]